MEEEIRMKRESSRWSSPRIAAVSALACGVLTHLYALTNNVQNYDSITQQPYGYGTGVTSGRWLLNLLGDFFQFWGGDYNLPVMDVFLFLLILAVSAGFLVSTLGIKNGLSAALIGGVMAVFPTVTSTIFFHYTAVYYGLSAFFAVFAAWVLPRHKYGVLFSALATACSLGIYQAYVPVTISVFVLVLIRDGLNQQRKPWDLIRQGLVDCLALLLGLVLYYLFLKATLAYYGAELSNYQGMNSMGKISLGTLPGLIKEAIYSVVMLPVKDYCGLSGMRIIRLLYALLAGISAVSLAYGLLVRVRKWSMAILEAGMCILFLIAVNFIVIMCPDSWVYTLMVYSFTLLPCAPLVILQTLQNREEGQENKKSIQSLLYKLCAVCVALMVFCYGYEANIQYTMADYVTHQTENYYNSLVTQIRMTEGFTPDKKWALIGRVEDPLLRSSWQHEIRYGGMSDTVDLLNSYSRFAWIYNYIGYVPEILSEEEMDELLETEEVKAMPCWPSQGSIQVIGDLVVVKFQEAGKFQRLY